MNALIIASYFIQKANSKSENDLTNLKLQKILYLAQGKYLGLHGEKHPLFTESIEAWQFGPVVRDVYNVFSECGASPITVLDIPDNAVTLDLDEEVTEHLDTGWDGYGIYSASYLVDLTHKQDPWMKNYQPSTKNTIPVSDMVAFFRAA
jgi:uncharacterized phage-associated protein